VLAFAILERWFPASWVDLLHTLLETIVCLTVALVGGLIVGLERERLHRPAGVVAHAVGEMGTVSDFNRLVQSIAMGIGFLGAGAIFRHGDDVRGVTTAASIWAMGAVGAAAGAGAIFFSLILSCVCYMVLRWMRFLDRRDDTKER
jgi:putative Mg2+ transporter-C (MgtC) family protein